MHMKYAIHTNKGWWTGTGFSTSWMAAQKLDDQEEQQRKAHRMVEEGMEANVLPAKRQKMEDISRHYACHGY
jgi:hypothetical protein